MAAGKWVLCVMLSSIISSYITYYHVGRSEGGLDGVLVTQSMAQVKSLVNNPVEKSQNSANRNIVTRENCEISVASAVSHAVHAGDSASNNTEPARLEDVQLSYEQKQNEISLFRKFTESKGGEVLSTAGNNYDAEPIDSAWAKVKEDELLVLLESNETLRATAPIELSCKSQNCRLILSAYDEDQIKSLYGAFKREVLQGGGGKNKQVVSYFNNPDRGEIHIYLSKNTVNTLFDDTVN